MEEWISPPPLSLGSSDKVASFIATFSISRKKRKILIFYFNSFDAPICVVGIVAINEPTNQSSDQSTSQIISQPINQPNQTNQNHPTKSNQPNQPTNQTNQPNRNQTNQPANLHINQPTPCPRIQPPPPTTNKCIKPSSTTIHTSDRWSVWSVWSIPTWWLMI